MSSEQARDFLNQATQSVQSGQFAQALSLVDQSLALDPSNGEAYLIRGISLSQTKQPDLATAAFRTAVDLMPDSPKPYYNLAVHYYSNGMKREAMEAARNTLAADGSHSQARDLLMRVQQEMGVPVDTPSGEAVPPGFGQGAQQQNPYTQPAAGYYRPGYEQPGGQLHSVAFVERMGEGWNKLGLALAIFGAVIFLYSLKNMPQMVEIMQQAMAGQQPKQPVTTPLDAIFQFAWYPYAFGSIFWIASDVADRRGSWLWLVAYLICCCCCPIQFIYYFAGRKS